MFTRLELSHHFPHDKEVIQDIALFQTRNTDKQIEACFSICLLYRIEPDVEAFNSWGIKQKSQRTTLK
jgi:hypothetical protein